jgi:hypothetical protein
MYKRCVNKKIGNNFFLTKKKKKKKRKKEKDEESPTLSKLVSFFLNKKGTIKSAADKDKLNFKGMPLKKLVE